MSYSDWLTANTTHGSRKFSYHGYEFQKQIVDDLSVDLSVIKPSQVGMTEVQVRKFLALLARNRGTAGIFSFPSEKMFKGNSKTRIKPIVAQPAFGNTGLDEERPHRSMDLYEVNGSFAHITALTEADATSTPADFLFHDELDLSDQAMIGLFQSRLQNSVFKITQKFSTPTHPGFGIDAAYTASDQHDYLNKCQSCGHWQAPLFEMRFLNLPGYHGDGNLELLDNEILSHMDLNESYVKCERCSGRLDLRNPSQREWVARYPGRLGRGYRISPFCTDRLTIEYIIRQLLKMKQLDNVKGWRNTVLGQTHSDGNSKLEPDVVRQIMKSPSSEDVGQLPVALGCDMGRTCHLSLGIVFGGKIHPFHFEQVPSSSIVSRARELREKYNIVCGGVDRHPYTPTSEQIRDESKRVILPIEYRGINTIAIKEDENENLDFIQVNRTKAIDDQVRAIRNKETSFSGYGGLGSVLVEQCCDMVRIETDEKPASWEKLTGNDHFMHSLVLMRASVKAQEIIRSSKQTSSRVLMGMIPIKAAPYPMLGQPSNAQRLI